MAACSKKKQVFLYKTNFNIFNQVIWWEYVMNHGNIISHTKFISNLFKQQILSSYSELKLKEPRH